MGYAAVQVGTRFIATAECRASEAYKAAIVGAGEADIVLTERLTGVPVSVINTPYVQRVGTRAGALARWMLRGRRTKRWMRAIFALRAAGRLKRSLLRESETEDYWQAGKSVVGIHAVAPAAEVVRRFAHAVPVRFQEDGGA